MYLKRPSSVAICRGLSPRIEDKSRKLCSRFKIHSPRPIQARHPALKFAAHLPLRGHSAIKLAAGNNPGITISIFERAINTLGRSLTAIGSAKPAFLSLHTQIGLFHFPWERIVSASTWRSYSCASPSSDSTRRSDEKVADVILLGSPITAYRGSSRRSKHR